MDLITQLIARLNSVNAPIPPVDTAETAVDSTAATDDTGSETDTDPEVYIDTDAITDTDTDTSGSSVPSLTGD